MNLSAALLQTSSSVRRMSCLCSCIAREDAAPYGFFPSRRIVWHLIHKTRIYRVSMCIRHQHRALLGLDTNFILQVDDSWLKHLIFFAESLEFGGCSGNLISYSTQQFYIHSRMLSSLFQTLFIQML